MGIKKVVGTLEILRFTNEERGRRPLLVEWYLHIFRREDHQTCTPYLAMYKSPDKTSKKIKWSQVISDTLGCGIAHIVVQLTPNEEPYL